MVLLVLLSLLGLSIITMHSGNIWKYMGNIWETCVKHMEIHFNPAAQCRAFERSQDDEPSERPLAAPQRALRQHP